MGEIKKKGWSVEILITSTPVGNVCYKPFKWNKIMIKKKGQKKKMKTYDEIKERKNSK